MIVKIVWVVVVLMILGGAGYYFFEGPGSFDLNYACANGGDLSVRMNDDHVVLHSKSATIGRERLSQVTAASGAKYENNEFTYWAQGQSATVWENNKVILANCELK